MTHAQTPAQQTSVNPVAGRIMGHRGAPSLAPENTLGGFRKAAEVGARWVELDVSLLADGTPVVNHDASVNRCSDSSGLLEAMTTAQLQGINNAALYPDWPAEPVPLLADTLALLNELDMGLNLELKDHGLPAEQVARQVIELLRSDFPHWDRLVISSFSMALLNACRAIDTELKLGLLFDALPVDWLQQAQRLTAFSVHLNWRTLSYRDARAVKEAGYQLYCWTANEPAQVESLWHWGMDAVITDNPQDFVGKLPAPVA